MGKVESEQQLRERIAYLEKELAERREYDNAVTHKVSRKNHGLIQLSVIHRAGYGTVVNPRGESSGKRWASANRKSLEETLSNVKAKLSTTDGAKEVAKKIAEAIRKRWPEHDFLIQALEPEWVETGPCPGCVRFSSGHPADKFPVVSEEAAHAGRPCRPRGFERLKEVVTIRVPS